MLHHLYRLFFWEIVAIEVFGRWYVIRPDQAFGFLTQNYWLPLVIDFWFAKVNHCGSQVINFFW